MILLVVQEIKTGRTVDRRLGTKEVILNWYGRLPSASSPIDSGIRFYFSTEDRSKVCVQDDEGEFDVQERTNYENAPNIKHFKYLKSALKELETQAEVKVPKKRGRPPKIRDGTDNMEGQTEVVKRKRGRPRKNRDTMDEGNGQVLTGEALDIVTGTIKKRRGRPPKNPQG